MMQRYAVMIALGGFAAGCAKTESADLLTSGIYAAISATATGDGTTTVSATLYVDDPNNLNFVELTGADQLTASSGGMQQTLTQTELGNIVSHTANFPGDAEGTQYTVNFARSVDAGAPATTVSLPAAFTIDDVPPNVSRAQPLVVTYAPFGAPDKLTWLLQGVCINVLSGTVASDSGELVIPPGTIIAPYGPTVAAASPTTCKVTLTLSRQRAGSLDPHYGKGGEALGQQTRDVSWMSTP